jgi:hypothetical protein
MIRLNIVVRCVQSQAGGSVAVAAPPTKAAGGLFSADMGKEKEIMREEVSTATTIHTIHYTTVSCDVHCEHSYCSDYNTLEA